jgi:lipopolysaccharide export system protein LptA
MLKAIYSFFRTQNKAQRLKIMGTLLYVLLLLAHHNICVAKRLRPADFLVFKADSILFDKKKQCMTLEGHIVLKQADRQLTAERLITYTNAQGDIKKIVAIGHPATYSALVFPNRPRLIATAQTIYYYPLTDQLDAVGEAHIIQGNNHFKGPRLHYNFKSKTLDTPPSKKGQTHILFAPLKTLIS